MTEFRWSYDPRTGELEVWVVKDERPSHYEKFGEDGYRFCAQGRIYADDEKGATLQFYTTRPLCKPDHPLAYDGCRMPHDVRLEALDVMRDYCRNAGLKIVQTEGLA